MKRLSVRQQQVLRFVREHVRAQGFPPSRSEIAEALGITHISTVNFHLNALMRKGRLELRPDTRRGIRLVRTDLPVVEEGKIPPKESLLAEHRIVRWIHEDVAAIFSQSPDYCLIVHGDGMNRTGLNDNDLAAIKAAQSAESGQVVVARVADRVMLRRYEPIDDRSIDLVPYSTNPALKPTRIDLSETRFQVEGVLVGLMIQFT